MQNYDYINGFCLNRILFIYTCSVKIIAVAQHCFCECYNKK